MLNKMLLSPDAPAGTSSEEQEKAARTLDYCYREIGKIYLKNHPADFDDEMACYVAAVLENDPAAEKAFAENREETVQENEAAGKEPIRFSDPAPETVAPAAPTEQKKPEKAPETPVPAAEEQKETEKAEPAAEPAKDPEPKPIPFSSFGKKVTEEDVKPDPFAELAKKARIEKLEVERAADISFSETTEKVTPEEEDLCPCCFEKLKPGAVFCTKCGAEVKNGKKADKRLKDVGTVLFDSDSDGELPVPPAGVFAAPAKRVCPACGKEARGEFLFCTGCGAKL